MANIKPIPYALRPEEGPILPSFGASIKVLARSDQTDRAFNLFVVTCPPGYATPLHIHYADDVAVYVLEGRLTFFWGSEKKWKRRQQQPGTRSRSWGHFPNDPEALPSLWIHRLADPSNKELEMKKFLKWTGILLGGFIGLTLLASVLLVPGGIKTLTQTYPDIPIESIAIPTSPDAVASGKHIATIWACTKCHGEDLSGKMLSDDPFIGTIPAANLTSGKGGIGASYRDADWIRAIRYGIEPHGHATIFMNNYAALSDQDLGDLIAYLKQISPVDAKYPANRYGPLSALAPAVGLYTPAAKMTDQSMPRPAAPAPGATVDYGRYLFADCSECHSASLAGKVKGWTQADFVRALQTGLLPGGKKLTPAMPLKTYGEMTGTELSALWQYLQSIQTQK